MSKSHLLMSLALGGAMLVGCNKEPETPTVAPRIPPAGSSTGPSMGSGMPPTMPGMTLPTLPDIVAPTTRPIDGGATLDGLPTTGPTIPPLPPLPTGPGTTGDSTGGGAGTGTGAPTPGNK